MRYGGTGAAAAIAVPMAIGGAVAMPAAAATLSAVARLKERVTDLADRAAWLSDTESRGYLLERTRRCLEQLG